jgi:hypothetical protein
VGCSFEESVQPAKKYDSLNTSSPIYLTSVGQSADIVIMKSILKQMNLEFVYEPSLTAEQLGSGGTILISTGASLKGMESAGVTAMQEIERANELVEHCKENGIKIVAFHFGGKERRGKISDELIRPIISASDLIIILSDSDEDNFFNNIAKLQKIEIYKLDGIEDVPTIMEGLFK